MSNPKISVLLPAYNEEKTISSTIESILGQTYANYEFVVIDDGSIDDTTQILEKYAKKDSRLKLIHNETNLGVSRTMRKGVENCIGDYIAIIDAGDICDPRRLEKQAGFLDKNPNVYIVGCFHHWINKKGEIVNSYTFPTEPKAIRAHIFGFGAVAAHPCIMIRRILFDKTGPYASDIKTSMDYELYLRNLACGFEMANIPEYLVSALRRSEGISLSQNRQIFRDMFSIRLRYLPKMPSLKNAFYTAVSFFVMLLPRSVLKKAVTSKLWSKKVRNLALKA
jgi:glycosyltransferase involved in cell wall biosynthesis